MKLLPMAFTLLSCSGSNHHLCVPVRERGYHPKDTSHSCHTAAWWPRSLGGVRTTCRHVGKRSMDMDPRPCRVQAAHRFIPGSLRFQRERQGSTSSGPETMVHGGTVRPCPTQLPCTVWLSITLIPRIVGDTRVTQHWEPQMPQQVPVPVLVNTHGPCVPGQWLGPLRGKELTASVCPASSSPGCSEGSVSPSSGRSLLCPRY